VAWGGRDGLGGGGGEKQPLSLRKVGQQPKTNEEPF